MKRTDLYVQHFYGQTYKIIGGSCYAILDSTKCSLVIGTLEHALLAPCVRWRNQLTGHLPRPCLYTPQSAFSQFATITREHLRSSMNMVISQDKTADVSHVEHRNDGETIVKAVQNVALADANSKQQPSLFTRRMFMVCSNIIRAYETS